MKLLQHSWSDMLVLDHIHQHMHNNLANEIMLHNGQKFDLLALGLLGVTTMADCFAQVIDRLQELKFDVGDYICLKFLLLLNPGKSSFYGRLTPPDHRIYRAHLDYLMIKFTKQSAITMAVKFSSLRILYTARMTTVFNGSVFVYVFYCRRQRDRQQ